MKNACARIQRCAAQAALAADGPDPEQAGAYLHDLATELDAILKSIPNPHSK